MCSSNKKKLCFFHLPHASFIFWWHIIKPTLISDWGGSTYPERETCLWIVQFKQSKQQQRKCKHQNYSFSNLAHCLELLNSLKHNKNAKSEWRKSLMISISTNGPLHQKGTLWVICFKYVSHRIAISVLAHCPELQARKASILMPLEVYDEQGRKPTPISKPEYILKKKNFLNGHLLLGLSYIKILDPKQMLFTF